MTVIREEGVGCRTAALTTLLLVLDAAALFGVGLWLTGSDTCTGSCETVGLTLLYAGGPVSALFGVLTGAVVVAWPVDLIVWAVTGFVIARIAGDRLRRAILFVVAAETTALAYGFALSFLVVRA